MQSLLVHALMNGGVSNDGKIYNSRKFYSAIGFLRRNNLVMPVCQVCRRKIADDSVDICDKSDNLHEFYKRNKPKKNGKKLYILTLSGELLTFTLKELK